MDEFAIIRSIIRDAGEMDADVSVGPGDDCAVICHGDGLLLLTDDALVEGVHFRRDIISMGELGARAAAVAMSDVAAMGGTPRWLLASVVAPRGMEKELQSLGRGVSSRARGEKACLVGGNLARGEHLLVSVTVVGTASRPVMLRSGARPGDLLAVTGTLGGASLALRDLLAGDARPGSDRLSGAWRVPPSRLRAGRGLREHATAAIDVSDGLLQDLTHLATASGVGARILARDLPLPGGYHDLAPVDDPLAPALAGGEDYEILAAVPPSRWEEASRAVAETGTDLTAIGIFTEPGDGVLIEHEDGTTERPVVGGWDHFR